MGWTQPVSPKCSDRVLHPASAMLSRAVMSTGSIPASRGFPALTPLLLAKTGRSWSAPPSTAVAIAAAVIGGTQPRRAVAVGAADAVGGRRVSLENAP